MSPQASALAVHADAPPGLAPDMAPAAGCALQVSSPASAQSSAVVAACEAYVVERMSANEGSHDFRHAFRVRNLAVRLARQETRRNVDMLVVELAALVHDVYDGKVWAPALDKLQDPSALLADDLRSVVGLTDPALIALVVTIAQGISYSKQQKQPIPKSQRCVEMDIVQDADRLESLGAIGLARCFAFGGSIAESLENTRQHFDDKLLCLLPLFCTEQGARIARERHSFLLDFVARFDDEVRFATLPPPRDEVA
jgi:uncharacterized protein